MSHIYTEYLLYSRKNYGNRATRERGGRERGEGRGGEGRGEERRDVCNGNNSCALLTCHTQ
jgi:hypothetical protein